eukprot:9474255-Alexandrium_andersonii.AAC.1
MLRSLARSSLRGNLPKYANFRRKRPRRQATQLTRRETHCSERIAGTSDGMSCTSRASSESHSCTRAQDCGNLLPAYGQRKAAGSRSPRPA